MTMTKFLIGKDWYPDDEFDDSASPYVALDARDAVERYFEDHRVDFDYASEAVIKVKDASGNVTVWDVEAIQVMQAYAKPREDTP